MILMQIICLYGYSLGCLIPILILCIIPTNILQWILIVYGLINSTLFLVMNLKAELELGSKKYIIFVIVATFQIMLGLLFKLLFFNMIYN